MMNVPLEEQVRELQAWRNSLSDVSSPPGMLVKIAAAMKREEDFWQARAEASRVELGAAEEAYMKLLRQEQQH